MIPAKYSVVRYIPDPGRNEALNVGIVLWSDDEMRLRIDREAVKRVVRENPQLASDALLSLQTELEEFLSRRVGLPGDVLPALIAAQKGFPVLLTEGRHTTLDEQADDALEQTMQRLVARVVTPRRRRGGGGQNPVQVVERTLRPLLRQNRVLRDHAFASSRSGVPRTVNFFANSTANVGLDVVKLAVARADEIRMRADAEAFKVEDIVACNEVTLLVYCSLAEDLELADASETALRIIQSAGADTVTSAEEAAKMMSTAATQSD